MKHVVRVLHPAVDAAKQVEKVPFVLPVQAHKVDWQDMINGHEEYALVLNGSVLGSVGQAADAKLATPNIITQTKAIERILVLAGKAVKRLHTSASQNSTPTHHQSALDAHETVGSKRRQPRRG